MELASGIAQEGTAALPERSAYCALTVPLPQVATGPPCAVNTAFWSTCPAASA